MLIRSQALKDFRVSIAIAEKLIKMELKFPDPPTSRCNKEVQGLRGGAIVLMVGAFDKYISEATQQRLNDLTKHSRYNPKKLPEELVYHNSNETIKKTIESISNNKKLTHAGKNIIFKNAATIVIDRDLNTQFFTDLVRSNPDSKKLRRLFNSLGKTDFFGSIKPEFDKRCGYPTPVSPDFIPSKLDTILLMRHKVAHTATALHVTRTDLADAVSFLKLLAELCDEELYNHIKVILK
jgi:hypothetical protein